MYDLGSFEMTDKVACAAAIREIGAGTASVEEVAERVVRFFFDELVDPETGERACALVRFYLTKPFAELDDVRQAFVRAALGAEPETPSMRCMTLMATAGEAESWNSPYRSVGHLAIPLASERMVLASPMIAQLILQLGLTVSQVLEPDASILVNSDEADYNVFYVPVALNSPFIPAQDQFVVRYGIASVLGVGGLLPSGELFALVLFSKVHIPVETARLFRTFALSLKSAILSAVLAAAQDDEPAV